MEQEEAVSLMVTQPSEALSITVKSDIRSPRRMSLPSSEGDVNTITSSVQPVTHETVDQHKSVYPYQSLQLVSEDKKAKIFGMHSVIQATIGQIQDKTQQILQDQERDLLRAFRSRQSMVQTELERERRKNENGSAEWVLRCHKLTEELEWLRELTDKLTNENTLFIKENKKYARQLASHEQDRGFLLKQLVTARKESARQRLLLETHLPGDQFQELGLKPETELKDVLERGQQMSQQMNLSMRQSTSRGNKLPSRLGTARVDDSVADQSSIGSVIDNGRKDVMQQEAQLVDAKKTSKRQKDRLAVVEAQLTRERKAENDMMGFFRQAVDDVRADIASRRQSKLRTLYGRSALNEGFYTVNSSTPPLDPRVVPLEEFGPRERVHVMEWLLTQDHVVKLLFDMLFPLNSNGGLADKQPSHTLLELSNTISLQRSKTASSGALPVVGKSRTTAGFSIPVTPAQSKYFSKPTTAKKSEELLHDQMDKDFMQF